MLPVSSSLMSWTASVERGLSLPCIPIPDKQSTNCWLKWTGQLSGFGIFKNFIVSIKCCCQERSPILNVLVLYRFKPNEGVIVVGATNFAEALDKYVYISYRKKQNIINI